MDARHFKSKKARLEALYNLFSSDDKVAIVIDPDPDALGAAWALKRILWRHVASSSIVAIRQIKRLNNISMVKLLKIPVTYYDDIDIDEFSKFVLVDGQPDHNDIFKSINFTTIIDHHPLTHQNNDEENKIFIDIRPNYGSTSTIMTEYLKAAQIKPSKSLATALLYGIKTDTRNFERHTIEEDIKAFLNLYPLANHSVLTKIEISDISLEDLVFFEEALKRKKVHKNKILVYLGKVNSADILVIISEFFLKIYDISWSIAAGIVDESLIIIARSDGYRKNAGKTLTRYFGSLGTAGGHAAMARAEIPLNTLLNYLGKSRANRRTLEKFLSKYLL